MSTVQFVSQVSWSHYRPSPLLPAFDSTGPSIILATISLVFNFRGFGAVLSYGFSCLFSIQFCCYYSPLVGWFCSWKNEHWLQWHLCYFGMFFLIILVLLAYGVVSFCTNAWDVVDGKNLYTSSIIFVFYSHLIGKK